MCFFFSMVYILLFVNWLECGSILFNVFVKLLMMLLYKFIWVFIFGDVLGGGLVFNKSMFMVLDIFVFLFRK